MSVAVKRELANGAVTTSSVGYTLAYNTLDNNKSPTTGIIASVSQDYAGVGGNVSYVTINPNKLGLTDNFYTKDSNYGDSTYYWRGVDVTFNARTRNNYINRNTNRTKGWQLKYF